MKKDTNPFRLAKPFLWNGKDLAQDALLPHAICFALARAVMEGLIPTAAKTRAQRMVMNRLNGCSLVTSYLYGLAHGPRRKARKKDLTPKNIQEFRHRWLDHLAEEWDKGVRK